VENNEVLGELSPEQKKAILEGKPLDEETLELFLKGRKVESITGKQKDGTPKPEKNLP